jgi:ketosteroid isomerase-like protein
MITSAHRLHYRLPPGGIAVYGEDVGAEHDALAVQVGAANRAFYRAFADGDLDAMDAVWSHGAHVRCVHPGWPMLEGWARIRDSWARILEGPDGELDITIDDVQVRAAGDVAWVTCIERLSAGDYDTAMMATNVFERDGGGDWRMVQHHASPILARDTGEGDGPDDRAGDDREERGGGNDVN